TDPYAFDPPFGSMSGSHLVAQAEGTSPLTPPVLERDLAPGEYYVAVSGAGNRYFHPLIADSGSDGSTGAYLLTLTATHLPATPPPPPPRPARSPGAPPPPPAAPSRRPRSSSASTSAPRSPPRRCT